MRCASRESVKDRRAVCSMCCIACKKCEKACPTGAMTVVDGLAVLDPALCISCYACVDACPQFCIDVYGREAASSADKVDGLANKYLGFAVDEVAASAARAKREAEAPEQPVGADA